MSALVEKDLEDSVATLLRDRLPGVRVVTSWSQADDGTVKGVETPSDSILIAVAAGAPTWDAYLVPSCSIPVALAITIRRETAPDAAALATVMEPIANLLLAMQLDVDACEPLTSVNFSADGVRLDGGDPPQYNSTSAVWRVSRSFTVRGVINQ